MKEEFYKEVTEIYDSAPKKVIQIVIIDYSAKTGRETSSIPTIGLHSVHKKK